MTTNSSADDVILLDIAAGIATIRFNRPAALNALNIGMAQRLRDVVGAVVADPAVRVIVLCGSGRAFVAGGDVADFRAAGEDAPQLVRPLIALMHAAIELLIGAPQPVIASVHGAVAGAGVSLAAAADLVIAAADTVFNLAYIKIANSPDCGATWTLPRSIGVHKAKELALLGENLDAAEAQRCGLVNRVVSVENLAAETHRIAEKLARSAPDAIAATKRLLNGSLQTSLREQLDREAESFAANAGTADFREALDAFFEKRPPKFQGS
jgi:2-(1,2-epoxy-1,2-dihydrophenyl)acetyl-CoA isomerase